MPFLLDLLQLYCHASVHGSGLLVLLQKVFLINLTVNNSFDVFPVRRVHLSINTAFKSRIFYMYAVFKVQLPSLFISFLAAACSSTPSPVQYHRPPGP